MKVDYIKKVRRRPLTWDRKLKKKGIPTWSEMLKEIKNI